MFALQQPSFLHVVKYRLVYWLSSENCKQEDPDGL